MAQYIDKDALVSEIEKRIKNLYPKGGQGMVVTKILKDHYEDLISFIDSMQEEPVNKDFEMALAEMIDKAQTSVVEPLVVAAQWKDELIKLAKSEEPVSEDLEKIVEEIAEPTILNAYGTKELARRLRNTICGTPVSEDLEEASKEWLRQQLDKSYANYGEAKMMELTRFDGYAMLDAIEFGVKWQKAKDESTTEDLGDYINELSKQFPEVSFAKLSRIAVRVSRWQRNQDTKNKLPEVINRTDLDEYAYQCAYDMSNDWMIENPTWHDVENACKLGANWQKENLWKSANGDDLPIIDREVIALLDNGKVVFAHRPPEYWDGKNIITGKVTRNYPKTYDKGGWNIPNIKYWLDVELPKEIEL